MKKVFPHLHNFRDFCGYRCVDGAVLRGNVFARSDNPRFVDAEEIKILRDRGFTTVIDLRRDYEPKDRPDLLAESEGFDYHLIPMYTDPYSSMGNLTTPDTIVAFFMEKLVASAPCISAVFRLFATAPNGVLFHCESGKDRTGLIAALLLLLCGVKEETIIEDYRLSYDNLYRGADPELLSDPVMIPMAETMSRFLSRFQERYSDPCEYFYLLGITEAEIRQIRYKIKENR